MDAAVPGILVAQAVGRIGNYFNQELFGRPTTLPWALYIDPAHRPASYLHHATFQPTFLYELVFDLALAGALVWLGHHRRIRAPGLFIYAAAANLLPRARALPAARALPVSLAGAAAMFLVTRLV